MPYKELSRNLGHFIHFYFKMCSINQRMVGKVPVPLFLPYPPSPLSLWPREKLLSPHLEKQDGSTLLTTRRWRNWGLASRGLPGAWTVRKASTHKALSTSQVSFCISHTFNLFHPKMSQWGWHGLSLSTPYGRGNWDTDKLSDLLEGIRPEFFPQSPCS